MRSRMPGNMLKTARFYMGQVVQHTKFDYRGVIVDVDANYCGTDEWYEQVARSRPPKEQPWYYVLVHRGEQTTYVAERHLKPDDEGGPIDHPLVGKRLGQFLNGRYELKDRLQ